MSNFSVIVVGAFALLLAGMAVYSVFVPQEVVYELGVRCDDPKAHQELIETLKLVYGDIYIWCDDETQRFKARVSM